MPAMAANIAVCQGWAIRAPAGTRTEPDHEAEADEGLDARAAAANAMIAAKTAARPTPTMKLMVVGVSLVGSRREQDDGNRREGDGRGAVRPCGHDPEELDRADRRRMRALH